MQTLKPGLICLAVILLPTVIISAAEPIPARLVRVRVIMEGRTVLEGSTSDDGRVDADGVWDYLHEVKLKPTDAFKDLTIAADGKDTTLENSGAPGQQRTLEVYVAYGGKAFPRSIRIIRIPKDRFGKEWRIDGKDVDRMFDSRYVTRSDVRRLENPARTKR